MTMRPQCDCGEVAESTITGNPDTWPGRLRAMGWADKLVGEMMHFVCPGCRAKSQNRHEVPDHHGAPMTVKPLSIPVQVSIGTLPIPPTPDDLLTLAKARLTMAKALEHEGTIDRGRVPLITGLDPVDRAFADMLAMCGHNSENDTDNNSDDISE